MPKETTGPFWVALALATIFVGLLIRRPVVSAVGTLATAALLIFWLRPRDRVMP